MKEKLEQRAFLLVLMGISILFLYLLKPFFAPIFWACALSLVFFPVYQRLEAWWGHRPNSSALATLLVSICVVVAPVILILLSFLQEAADLYRRIEEGEVKPGAVLDSVQSALPALQTLIDRLGIDLDSIKKQAADAAVNLSRILAQHALSIGQSAFGFVLNLALMLYLAFFLLRDGRKLIRLLIRALPLGDARERLLFAKFAEVTRATIKGNLMVAAVQGALGGIIFAILGLPAAVLWGVAMAVLSLLPAVGAGLVWGPAAIYLFASGSWVSAVVLTLYGILVIGLADNVLRPILVGRDTKLPDWLVLLSTLGGLVMVGINGFVIGPLVAALFVVFWQIFSNDFYRGDGDETLGDTEAPPPLPAEEQSS
ncbi:MAG: AI-2E family transporter [Porticoccaceae bacterium]